MKKRKRSCWNSISLEDMCIRQLIQSDYAGKRTGCCRKTSSLLLNRRNVLTKYLWLLLLPVFFATAGRTQDKSPLSNEEIKSYKTQVTRLVSFLEGTLNFIGNPDNPFKEKEIVINESYSKIFLHDKVQIEDDLDENREYPIYKDVQAYLKDIGFFYHSVDFTFGITDITHYINADGGHFFLVTLIRKLDGVTLRNDSVNSQKTRYVEINLDLTRDDFKIASIYTHKFNEKEEVRKWWNGMDPAWRNYFGKEKQAGDSILLSDILYFEDSLIVVRHNNKTGTDVRGMETLFDKTPRDTTATDTLSYDTKQLYSAIYAILKKTEVDVSGMLTIRDLSPLSELSELRHLDCSNTLVNDLTPLRSLNKLEALDCRGIPVKDLTPLQYSSQLQQLNIENTMITDLNPIIHLHRLGKIHCSGNKIIDFTPLEALPALRHLECDSIEIYDPGALANLTNLETLSINSTFISNLEPLSELVSLRLLNCNNTLVVSIEPLKDLHDLEYLSINNTGVRSLEPLNGHPGLKRIYCNNTLISGSDAIRFMRDNPGCLVVYESEELKKSWAEMNDSWKNIFSLSLGLTGTPTEEELHGLLRIEELDLAGRGDITDLSPLRKLYNLKKLNLSGSGANDFSPLMELFKLEYLDVSGTAITTTDNLALLSELQTLIIENTRIGSLMPLVNLNLKYIYADESGVNDQESFDFVKQRPGCLVVFKTSQLYNWWQNLPEVWREYFKEVHSFTDLPSPEEMHTLLYSEKMEVVNNRGISDLKPLIMLRNLKEISLSGTQVTDISTLTSFRHLTRLELNQCPVSDLLPLAQMTSLARLSIQNTPVKDLKPLASLTGLQYLNVSGTSVGNLKPVESMTELRVIEFSNTSIKNITPLFNCKQLEKVVCFNTRVSEKSIEKFRALNPGCEVVHY
ncbi:MAG: hypothetical protein JXA03_08570 [Bacteroidales bacterium]|nr:hypothetical protein [Bacteroidales bacterium]